MTNLKEFCQELMLMLEGVRNYDHPAFEAVRVKLREAIASEDGFRRDGEMTARVPLIAIEPMYNAVFDVGADPVIVDSDGPRLAPELRDMPAPAPKARLKSVAKPKPVDGE
ncbi:MAG: hypothetical protein IPL79_19995 [Myxococcales bacterium]|nr:hypothetical protein [Myxococcales bacterium]